MLKELKKNVADTFQGLKAPRAGFCVLKLSKIDLTVHPSFLVHVEVWISNQNTIS